MTKILQFCSIIDPTKGGAPSTTWGSFQALAEISECELVVIGESFDVEREFRKQHVAPDIHFLNKRRKTPYGKFLNLRELIFLSRKIKTTDVVLVHQIFSLTTIMIPIMSMVLKKKYFVMPHGSLNEYHLRDSKIRKYLIMKIALNAVLNSAEAILVATEQEKLEVLKKVRTRVEVVGIGFPKVPTEPRIGSNSEPNFLFLGRFSKKKNLDLTIRAFAEFSKDSTDSKLIVVGGGDFEELEKIEECIEELKIQDRVEIHGWVSGLEKQRIFESSKYFVLISDDENFAVAVAEAQSYGLPALVTKEVALSSGIEKFQSGFVLKSKDLDNVVQGFYEISKIDYGKATEQAIKHARTLYWSGTISEWIKVLES